MDAMMNSPNHPPAASAPPLSTGALGAPPPVANLGMPIALADEPPIDFRPWLPHHGRVFDTAFAMDTETTLIDEDRPKATPRLVLATACDGHQGVWIAPNRTAAFLAAHADCEVVFHNAPFDLRVLQQQLGTPPALDLDLYQWVDKNRVWDTQLLHKLYTLAVEGHVAGGTGESTLETCAEKYLGVRLPKETLDENGHVVRLSYGRWLDRPPAKIGRVYLEYAARDVVATWRLYHELRRRIDDLLRSQAAAGAFGFADPDWLARQAERFGPLTHHIQIRGAIVLDAITANGLRMDVGRLAECCKALEAKEQELRGRLRDHGFLPGEGSAKALQAILKDVEREVGLTLPRTATGQYATSEEALSELPSHGFVDSFLEWKSTQKLLEFLNKGRERLHPSFNPLVVTGRTSSFGQINAQNLPRDDRVRSCFVPSEGHVLLSADYSTIELVTLAQAIETQFGRASEMGEAIRRGEDLHMLVAARTTGKPEQQVTAAERQKAKIINFGKPGGMGDRTLQKIARNEYGLALDDDEVARLSEAWLEMFPEMRDFLAADVDVGQAVGRTFGLSVGAYQEATGRSMPHDEQTPAILGGMLLKAIGQENPQTGNGRAYTTAEIGYFFSALAERLDVVPAKYHRDVQQRKPSPGLRHAIGSRLGAHGVFTASGRLRAAASHTARRNTIFQGLAADGAKLALWRLFRAGVRIVNFIHDEVLVEAPAGEDLHAAAERVRAAMEAGMQEVVPDLPIKIEVAAMDRWSKAAGAVYDDDGRLQIWRPAPSQADEVEEVANDDEASLAA